MLREDEAWSKREKKFRPMHNVRFLNMDFVIFAYYMYIGVKTFLTVIMHLRNIACGYLLERISNMLKGIFQ